MRTALTVAGNLTSTPSSRWLKDGTHVTDFGLAHNDRRHDRATGLWVDGATTFYTVTCWRTLASNVVACLQKGDAVVVQGWFSSHEYERRDGSVRTELRIEGRSVGPDLGRVVAPVVRIPRPTPAPADEPSPEAAPEQDGAALLVPVPDAAPSDGEDADEPDVDAEPDFAQAARR